MNRQKNQIRAELYIAGDQAKAYFGLLKRQKEEVERELGYTGLSGMDCRRGATAG